MIPVGSEIRWFGMQLVLSCATVWVNYVASAPLQNATHQLRFPLILSLVFLAVAFGLEVCRVRMGVFRRDMEKWKAVDAVGAEGVCGSDEMGRERSLAVPMTGNKESVSGVVTEEGSERSA